MGHSPLVDNFLNLHREQFISSGVPEIYWPTLCRKLVNQLFDAGTSFQLLQVEYDEGKLDHEPTWALQATRNIRVDDENAIYLIDHAWTFRLPNPKEHLLAYPNLRTRMCNILGIAKNDEKAIKNILKHMWKVCNTYSVSNSSNVEDRLPVWYVMDEIGCAVMHSDSPNCRIVPFIYANDQTTYSLLFPIQDIEEGTVLVRDYAEGITDPTARSAALLPWRPETFEAHTVIPPMPGPDYFLQGHIEERLPEMLITENKVKDKYKVFTEYALIKEYLDDDKFEIVEHHEDADILWYTHHFKDYDALSSTPDKYVNQFPFEYVITVKDLLSVTCRRGASFPKWVPITYNLKTEISNFINYFKQREKENLDNTWIIKPYNLARGLDTHVTDNLDFIVRLPATGPKIAQKYVENPVLFYRPECDGNVKFDVRFVIILTSVNPLKVFIYKNFFLRFANTPFGLDDFSDYEKHFTVMNYNENADLHHMLCSDFKEKWKHHYPAINWDDIEKSVYNMLKTVLELATKEKPPCGIAESPQSRALYAVDLMLEWESDNVVQPKLLEINWTPDCQRACAYYPDFYNNIFRLMFLNECSDAFYEL